MGRSQYTGLPRAPQLIGLPAASKQGASVSRSTIDFSSFGTAIGNLIDGGGLSTAFDGLSHGYATGARKSPSSSGMGNWIGRDLLYPAVITSFEVSAPTDDYFRGDNYSGALTLWASDTTRPGGVCVWSGVYPSGMAARVFDQIAAPIVGRYCWLELEGNGTNGINAQRFVLKGYFS